MTITSTPSEIAYSGDNVSTTFPIPFPFDAASDLKVIRADATGILTVLTSGFTVSGGGGSTGSLTLSSALLSGYKLTILDDPQRTQAADYIANDDFPAEAHEKALDRGVRISKRLWQLIQRCLRTADGDPITDLTLGSVDNRKGKYLFFNAVTGAIEYAANVVNTVLSQSIIAQLLNPQSPAESAASVIPANYWIPSHLSDGIIRPRRYGAVYDGSTNDYAAFASAYAVAAQLTHCKVLIEGNTAIASASLPFTVPSGCHTTGLGVDASLLTVTGTSVAASIWNCADVSNTTFSDFTAYGNSQANAYAVGCATSWTNSGSSVLYNHTVRNCRFENFKGDYWIHAQNNGTAAMKNFIVTNNTFVSFSGNARTPASTGADSACIGFSGSGTSLTGTVEGVVITGNIGECDYIKSLVVGYQSTKFISIANNQALRCGTIGISADSGAYAIMLYDSSGFQPPSRWAITGNLVASPFSCGVYLASAGLGSITGNTIHGQTDTADGTLPKGGIAINATNGSITISGNEITECTRAISLASGAHDLEISGNCLDSSVTSAVAVKMNSGAGALKNISIADNSMRMSGATSIGVRVQSFTGAANLADQIMIAGNRINTTSYCIQHVSDDASFNVQDVRIQGNLLTSAQQHISFTNTTNPISITSNVCTGNPSSDGIDVSSSTKVAVTGNVMEGFTTAYAFKTNNSQGEFWGNSWVRGNATIDPAGTGEILGTVIPTWTGVVAMKVQTAYSGEAGAGGSKYLVTGWIYSGTAWLPMRSLDGN